MTDAPRDLQKVLPVIEKYLKKKLEPKQLAFWLFAFPYKDGPVAYVGNIRKEDAREIIRQVLAAWDMEDQTGRPN